MTVRDIQTFTQDNQLVFITKSRDYSLQEGIYFGEMQHIPLDLTYLRVSHFYSDYVPTHGSFIGVRVTD